MQQRDRPIFQGRVIVVFFKGTCARIYVLFQNSCRDFFLFAPFFLLFCSFFLFLQLCMLHYEEKKSLWRWWWHTHTLMLKPVKKNTEDQLGKPPILSSFLSLFLLLPFLFLPKIAINKIMRLYIHVLTLKVALCYAYGQSLFFSLSSKVCFAIDQ